MTRLALLRLIRLTVALVLVGGVGLPASAVPPSLSGATPTGVPRGTATEVSFNGANLTGNPRVVAPFVFQATPAPKADASNLRLQLKVDPHTAPGVYTVRVQTDEGLSNPILFAVGQVPQVAEVEPNNTFEAAQAVPGLIVVEGAAAGNDVDVFRFSGKKGQRLVVDAQCARIGSTLDPTIRLVTANHKYIGSADDTLGMLVDARLTAVLPEDGDYVLELSDTKYQGAGRSNYRLLIGQVPVADEVYPLGGPRGDVIGFEVRGGTLAGSYLGAARVEARPFDQEFTPRLNTARLGVAPPFDPAFDLENLIPLAVSSEVEVREPSSPDAPPIKAAPPVVFNGRLEAPGDQDTFKLAVSAGQSLHVEVHAADLGSAMDGQLEVRGPTGNTIASNDDTQIAPTGRGNRAPGIVSPDPSLDFNVPAGVSEVSLVLKDLEGRGGVGYAYRIEVTPKAASFELQLAETEASLVKGGNVVVAVTAVRAGYDGPITISVLDPPPGITVRGAVIPAGQTAGAFSLAAQPDAALGLVPLKVVGKGTGDLTVPAGKLIVFAKQGNLPVSTRNQVGLWSAPAAALPVSLDTASTPIEVPHGFGVPVTIKATRSGTETAALAITPLPISAGLTVAAGKIAEKANEGAVTVTAAVDAPLAVTSLGLIAKGKVAGQDRTLGIPVIAVSVVRPAALELAVAKAELSAGNTFELKGKVVRKAPFKDPVTVKLDGLPAGVKAEPATVPADKSEFTLKVTADAKAAAATAQTKVLAAFQINKKDYPTPPSAFELKVVPAK